MKSRRSPEQIIADLQAKIEQVKRREKAREMKQSPATKQLLAAVRALDKALEAASKADDGALKQALSDGREPLVAYLALEGLKMPGRRGRKQRPAPP